MIGLFKLQALKRTLTKEKQVLKDQRNAAINELKNLNKQLKKLEIITVYGYNSYIERSCNNEKNPT